MEHLASVCRDVLGNTTLTTLVYSLHFHFIRPKFDINRLPQLSPVDYVDKVCDCSLQVCTFLLCTRVTLCIEDNLANEMNYGKSGHV